jgi:hypothetical protein
VRETPSVLGYSTVLALHTFGMSFLVGLSAMMALRSLGFARNLPLAPMEKFYPLVIAGFWVNALTGIILTMLAAVSLFRNPDFYIKLAAIAGAIVTLRMLHQELFEQRVALDAAGRAPLKTRIVAVAMLLFWTIAVTAGRLTAYSNFVRIRTVVAIFIALVAMVAVRHVVARVFSVGTPSLAPVAPQATNR